MMMHPRTIATRNTGRGFTLIEVLVVVMIVGVIMGIVYESFAAVLNGTENARRSADEMRVRQYLIQRLSDSFASIYVDGRYLSESCQFLGSSQGAGASAEDTLEFCSAAPLSGGRALPGLLKRIHFEVTNHSDDGLDMRTSENDSASDEESSKVLECTEEMVASTYVSQAGGLETNDTVNTFQTESPSWSVPIQSVDFAYFDGKEWQEEWDSLGIGRLPWCVRARINFFHGDEEDTSSSGDTPDLEMIFPIPGGNGVTTTASLWEQVLFPYGNTMQGEEAGGVVQDNEAQDNGAVTRPTIGGMGRRSF